MNTSAPTDPHAVPGVLAALGLGGARVGHGGEPILRTWSTGLAAQGEPVAAVAVRVLDGGSLGDEATGARVAAPIAREVLAAALAMGAP